MNPYKHSEISVNRWGGEIEDYYKIHEFIDCTKELCSDNRHRILHTHWGIRRVIIPIFGVTITNSKGKKINVKDLVERDHILPDYGNRFIPTLADFVDAMDDSDIEKEKLNKIYKQLCTTPEMNNLLLSPLHITGKLKSLYITFNSWFINEITPQIIDSKLIFNDFLASPSDFFKRIQFKPWMNNGDGYPPSAEGLVGENTNP